MEKRKEKIIREEDMASASSGELLSSGVAEKNKFLQQSKNVCRNQIGPLKRICKMRILMRALKLQIARLSYAKGRCKYSEDERNCIKLIDAKIFKLNTELKNLDAMIRKRQQTLK